MIETQFFQRGLDRTRPPSAVTRKGSDVRTMFVVVAASAVTFLFGSLQESASGAQPQAAEPAPIRLRAVTTVAGNEARSVSVYLPKDVDVNGRFEGRVDRRPPYDFFGDGRLTAVLLTEDGDDHPLGDGASLLSWTYGRCLRQGCDARGLRLTNVVPFGPLEFRNDKVFLPRGRYKLYFIADGVWAKFRMELDGLRGRVEIKPSAPVIADLRTLRPQPSAEGAEGASWQGKSTELSGRGLSLLGLWLEGDGEAVKGEGGVCVYEEKPEDEVAAYMPPCPTADFHQSVPLQARTTEFSYYTKDLIVDAGMGVYYATASALKRAGGTTLWFEL